MEVMRGTYTPKFLIDLNAVVDGNRVSALLTDSLDQVSLALFPPLPGQVVSVGDDDLGYGKGIVVGLHGAVVDLEIDWDSWGPDPASHLFMGPIAVWEVATDVSGESQPSVNLSPALHH